ncbi:two component transcriptional regulator, LytTR family [Reichenbachiella faecimaris]|uniref:Two component transcriptional regulator, LytTR family n=1 Tax=Reichenbachiella faecimaris TaxID=692418 RepID=A0A1W2GFQ5_REIFA|nr:LytTR family DNA-binding domain-containing protein [Reichenbachiella faecimaris]SMD35411.1 two component transcriptional regulator, LytTR family [Reichenbachiella faecimaris]
MKAIIIDDERLARKELTTLLAEFPEIEIVDEAVNADDAVEKIQQHDPDLIFLDIQMPDKTGFELLEMLEKTPLVVFTTAYDQFAIKAFEFNALDYLLKPIDTKRLADVVKKVLDQSIKPTVDVEESSEKLKSSDQVFVKDGEKCWFVKLEKIRLFESDGNYIKVYFDGFRPMIHKSLNALDEKLDDKSFFRASRKHIINLGWVESIEPWFNGGLMVQLKDGEKVEVSRRQASKFKERMSL